MRDGRTLVQWADERYRGGPLTPISDDDRDAKFRMCAEGVLGSEAQAELLGLVRRIDHSADLSRVMERNAGEATRDMCRGYPI
jgi:hypothetical protein